MPPHISAARERQRLDVVIARPLRAFRREIAQLSDHDLQHLRSRLETRRIGAHFSRGAHGLARHMAGQELPLLERRLALVIARQDTPHARQLRLVEPAAHDDATMAHVTPLDHMDNRQAA